MGVCCQGWVEETRGTTKLVVDSVVMCDPIERLTVGRNLGRSGRCMLMIHRFRPIYIVFFHLFVEANEYALYIYNFLYRHARMLRRFYEVSEKKIELYSTGWFQG